MNEFDELKMIENSLATRAQDKSGFKSMVSQPDLLQSFLAISTALLKVNGQLDGVQAELKRANDSAEAYSRLDFEVKQASAKIDAATNQIMGLAVSVEKRLKTVDVLEAKYQKLVDNVHAVLEKLERAL